MKDEGLKRSEYKTDGITLTNGMMQSTRKRMDYVKAVVVSLFNDDIKMTEEVHVPVQKFAEWMIKRQLAGKKTGSVEGVTWDRTACLLDNGKVIFSRTDINVMSFHGSFKCRWDEERGVHLPVSLSIGASRAAGLSWKCDEKILGEIHGREILS